MAIKFRNRTPNSNRSRFCIFCVSHVFVHALSIRQDANVPAGKDAAEENTSHGMSRQQGSQWYHGMQ